MKRKFYSGFVIFLLLLAVLPADFANAATIWTVDTIVDEKDDSCTDGDCSLRDAVTTAVAGDTIRFNVAFNSTITLNGTQIVLNKDLIIQGPGEALLTISGGALSRVFNVETGHTVHIARLTIADGAASDGGGIYNSGTLMITNCKFDHNVATNYGGGLYNVSDMSADLSDVTFTSNEASKGGGLYLDDDSVATFSTISFKNNAAILHGGGMYIYSANPSLDDVTFDTNTAAYGGGLYVRLSDNPTLTNVTFIKNTVSNRGGGMFNDNSDAPNLTDVTFESNSASYGGGMGNNNSHPNLTNVTFYDNSASTTGGGMVNDNSNPNLTNVTFSENISTGPSGGGMANFESSPILDNVTFYDNSSSSHGSGISNLTTSNPTIRNTIIWSDAAPGSTVYYHDAGSTPTVSDSLIQGGYPDGTNIIQDDPLLGTLSDNGGATETNPLQAGSNAIDAGNDANCPLTDQRGVERTYGQSCDIGAYEYEYTRESFLSTGTYDGWIRESKETSGTGGSMDAVSTTFLLGDDAYDRQYRSILHFDTSSLPNDAVIAKAILKIKRNSTVGGNPFTTHGNIIADIRSGPFYGNPALQWIDFRAVPSLNFAGTIFNTPSTGNWYSGELKETAFPHVNLTGETQIRVRFYTDDNDDAGADYMRFYSGNHSYSSYLPILELDYDTP